jgi:fructose-bisphosphate aldolase class II
VPVEQIQEGIKFGVRKINIDTDLRLASTGAIRRYMAKNPAEFDPRKYLQESVKAMTEICKDRYLAFGTAGNASKIKAISLEQMVKLYESGKLTPNIK